jgi:hypothetical protein
MCDLTFGSVGLTPAFVLQLLVFVFGLLIACDATA